jgi:hypothetical protein
VPIEISSPGWRIKRVAGSRGAAAQAAAPDLPGLPPEFLTPESRVAEEAVLEPAPAIRGRLEVDRARKIFTRFDVVALGKASGMPTDANGKVIIRTGAYPVGIAFELIADPAPAERLHPRGARDNPAAYPAPK